jgi:flagella basal body P-ring formation protein FlgA
MRRLASSLIVVASVVVGAAPSRAAVLSAQADPRVLDAIAAAVRQRMAGDAEVIVESAEIFIPAGTPADARIQAAPDPAARLGGLVRFALIVDGVRSGRADARLHVNVAQARATRAIVRGETLNAADVEDARGEIADGPLRRRPRAAELAGGRALRDLAAGQLVTATAVAVPPAVRTGQTVTAVSRAFGIEASATMVAAESGDAGAVIRVVNRATRRPLRARIVSSELVEIIHD